MFVLKLLSVWACEWYHKFSINIMSSILGPCFLALEGNCYSSNAYHCPGKVLSTPAKLLEDGAAFKPCCGKTRRKSRMRWTPLCFHSQSTTLSRPDSTACFVCLDKIRTLWCPSGWADLQALRRWRHCTLGSSQSTALYLVAYFLLTHVAFLSNKQLFYGLPPTEARWRFCYNPMGDERCYFKSIFISAFKLIGKGFFCATILRDWQRRNYMAHSRSFS